MIDKMTRQTIITLHKSGKSCRHISELLSISRNTIKKILSEGEEPSKQERDKQANDLIPIIKTIFERVDGNVIRVQEILKSDYDEEVAYSTLTRITRDINLRKSKERYGEYIFEP